MENNKANEWIEGGRKMHEFELIHTIKQKSYRQASLIKGVGDDAAVFRSAGQDVVTALDTFVDRVHFSKETMDEIDLGYRVLAVNISDLAAMGAVPKFYLVSIVIPYDMSQDQVTSIFTGMEEIAGQYQMDLIGGDTVIGEVLTISVTVIGYVNRNQVRYRHDAKENDLVFVTGTLGDASAGLDILLNKASVEQTDYLIKRHRRPEPRLHFANDLQHIKRLALNDISDGLANELHEIAQASQVTIQIKDEKIPVSKALQQFSIEKQKNCQYFGGEDFELVGTVSEADWPEVVAAAEKNNLQVTKIGRVKRDAGHPVLLEEKGRLSPLAKKGFIHTK